MIYVIGLENNKKFVYETSANRQLSDDHELFTEVYALYHYCRLYKPVSILYKTETQTIQQALINTMILYGYNNVRGHIYTEPELPHYKIKVIEEEIQEFINKSISTLDFMKNYEKDKKVSKSELEYLLLYKKKEKTFIKKALYIRSLFDNVETFTEFYENLFKKCNEILIGLNVPNRLALATRNMKPITRLVDLYMSVFSADMINQGNQYKYLQYMLVGIIDSEHIDTIIHNKYVSVFRRYTEKIEKGLEITEPETIQCKELVAIFLYMANYLWNIKEENDFCLLEFETQSPDAIIETIEKQILYYRYMIMRDL